MKEFAHRRQRVELLDGAMTMHRLIAQAIEENRFGKDRDSGGRFESRLVEERTQVVFCLGDGSSSHLAIIARLSTPDKPAARGSTYVIALFSKRRCLDIHPD